MPEWNFADVYEAVAAATPDAPCQIQGDRVVTWRAFDRAGERLGGRPHRRRPRAPDEGRGLPDNCPEYLQTYVGGLQGRTRSGEHQLPVRPRGDRVPVRQRRRRGGRVPRHLRRLLGQIRDRLPKVRRWYAVADGTAPIPDWAVPTTSVVAAGAERVGRAVGPFSGKDLLLLYTGGTTGMPKGVMWQQDDLFNVLGGGGKPLLGLSRPTSVAEIGAPCGPPDRPSCDAHGVSAYARHGPVLRRSSR